MTTSTITGKWSLITGASSGIGMEMARELASLGSNVILVARRRLPMDELAAELQQSYSVEVEVVSLDLSSPESAQKLYDQLKASGREVSYLLNNAGIGQFGKFLDRSLEEIETLLDLNTRTLVRLSHLFAADMVERKFGRILQVASLLGFQAVPGYGVYAASKGFVLLFGEALNRELRGTGVTCTVLSPGLTRTAFLDVAGQQPNLMQRMMMMETRTVARSGVRAMLKSKSLIVPGLINRLVMFSNRLMPRIVATEVFKLVMSGPETKNR